eukprot:scaffold37826_cov155-Skeletonema_dohrnii-CCMP3373.AAC.3
MDPPEATEVAEVAPPPPPPPGGGKEEEPYMFRGPYFSQSYRCSNWDLLPETQCKTTTTRSICLTTAIKRELTREFPVLLSSSTLDITISVNFLAW